MEERVAGSEISIHPSNLGCNPQIKTWGGQTGGGAAVARARKVGAKLGDVQGIAPASHSNLVVHQRRGNR